MTAAPKVQRKGRGKARASLDLINAAREILTQIQPASVRAVCYQLFVRKLIPSMKKNETNKVGTQLVWARENGIIDWSWIVDETRSAEQRASWRNPQSILTQAVQQYRKDYWADQQRRVEIWSEKGTVRGTLARVLDDCGVAFRVMHGYSSATALNDASERSADDEKPLHVIYVGDWDPSGLHMSEVDIPARIERYGGNIEFERVAILETDTNLPSFAAGEKRTDSRYRWFVENHGDRCIELDALPPPELRDRVGVAVTHLIDFDRWEHARKIEGAEIASMRVGLEGFQQVLRGNSMPASKYPGGPA